MKILLDENVPVQLIEPLKWLLRGHRISHANETWKGIKDEQLYDKARRSGYELVITVDGNQLLNDRICKAIHRSGVHCAFLDVGRSSLDDLAAASAALVHCARDITNLLEDAEGQRIITIQRLGERSLFTVYDPRKEAPSPYWPRKQHGEHKPSRGPRKRT